MSNVKLAVENCERALSGVFTDEDMKYLFNRDLQFIKYLVKSGKLIDERFCLNAARCGNVEAFKWGNKKGFPFHYERYIELDVEEVPAIVDAIADSHRFVTADLLLAIHFDKPLVAVKILDQLQLKWTPELTVKALKCGSWKVLKWAHSLDNFADLDLAPKKEESEEEPLTAVAIQQWIAVNGPPSSFTAHEVAAKGRLDVLKWFFPNAKGCGSKTWLVARCYEHVDILHWLHQCRPDNPDFKKDVVISLAKTLNRKDILTLYEMD